MEGGNVSSFGRVPNPPDPRDKAYAMGALLATLPPVELPVSKVWTPPDNVLSQGNVGACVGFAGAAWLEAEPIVQHVRDATGFYLYAQCKLIDGLPPGTEGTYSRSLMQVMTSHGAVGSYHWATSLADFDEWLLTQGPILIGTSWYQGMMNPDANGTVSTTGSIVGGHETLIYGKLQDGRYIGRNSWGRWWGRYGGDFCLTRDQLQYLLFGNPEWPGDACAAFQIGAVFNPGDAMQAPAPFLDGFPWPDGSPISQEFGAMDSGYPHRGMDAAIPIGTPLRARYPGEVVTFLNSLTPYNGQMVPGFGIGVCVKYDTSPPVYGLVAHCSQVNVSIGDRVGTGQVIALSGNTGVSSGPHCHYQTCSTPDFPTDIRASWNPRTLIGGDAMTPQELARLERVERIIGGVAFEGTCYPGTEFLIGKPGGFPDGTQVTPEGQTGPKTLLSGESALAYMDARQFSFGLGLQHEQAAFTTHLKDGHGGH